MDDEGDFKKARGFLLTYSALVLALWYFGADLTQFKLMGNEVQLHQRADSAWLVLAVVNIYFWFRCYQRVPQLGLYFDKPMNDLYDRSLVWVALKLKRQTLSKLAHEHFSSNHTHPIKMRIIGYEGDVTVRGSIDQDGRYSIDDPTKLHQISRAQRTKMSLHAAYSTIDGEQGQQFSGYGQLTYVPSVLLTWPVKAFVIARGALVTPWFTDHIAPLALGGISTSFALWKWCEMNFFTTTISHAALLSIR